VKIVYCARLVRQGIWQTLNISKFSSKELRHGIGGGRSILTYSRTSIERLFVEIAVLDLI